MTSQHATAGPAASAPANAAAERLAAERLADARDLMRPWTVIDAHGHSLDLAFRRGGRLDAPLLGTTDIPMLRAGGVTVQLTRDVHARHRALGAARPLRRESARCGAPNARLPPRRARRPGRAFGRPHRNRRRHRSGEGERPGRPARRDGGDRRAGRRSRDPANLPPPRAAPRLPRPRANERLRLGHAGLGARRDAAIRSRHRSAGLLHGRRPGTDRGVPAARDPRRPDAPRRSRVLRGARRHEPAGDRELMPALGP